MQLVVQVYQDAPAANAPATPETAFQQALAKNSCGFGVMFAGGPDSSIWPGCALQVSYGLFYQFPAWLLAQVAYFFNVLISVTLYSGLLQSPFVSRLGELFATFPIFSLFWFCSMSRLNLF